jgi:hypothetical protein
MKTHAIEWTSPDLTGSTGSLHPVENLNSATRLVRRGILALTPALTLIIGAVWLITIPQMVVFLQAALWTSGILFFGLALDSQKATIGLSLATGFALPLLALLSSTVAVEFAIVAVALVAAWVTAAIYNHTRHKPAGE